MDSYAQSARSQSKSKTDIEEKPAKTKSAKHVETDSHISSEYSQDFADSASKDESLGKSSLVGSKNKLQAKAKDIEESNAYSETFEEESVSQSQAPLKQLDQSAGKKKMESVPEESIDESIMEQSKMSASSSK